MTMQLAITRKKEKVETMSVKKKDRITDIFVFIFLTMGAIVMIAPLLWMVSTSLKSKDEVFSLPPVWIPTDISFNKYMEIWNSVALRTILAIALGSIVARFLLDYAGFAQRLQFLIG
jgi:multiple sugar transport system permease protein